jgi:hypothetical protein
METDSKHRHSHRHHGHSSSDHRKGGRASGEADASSSMRHSKSTGQLPVPTATTSVEPKSGNSSGQILPRFMLPDPSRSPSKLVYDKQSTSLQQTFEFKREELQLQQAAIAKQDAEIQRRTNATRLRCVQERAEKTVNQRELDAFLNRQIEFKHSEQKRLAAVDAASTNFDAVRVLPRDPIVTREQRQAAKLKLRGRLHDQVALKDSLAKQRRNVDRAESAYFLTKVAEQGDREREQRDELRRLTREALTTGWQQQRAIKGECERLTRPSDPK